MEKRNFTRMSMDGTIWYQKNYDESDFSFGKVAIKDISAGGLSVETEDINTPGITLMIKFHIPSYSEKITAAAEVVHVKRLDTDKYYVGMKFTEIKPEARSEIIKFVDKNIYSVN